jgi:hypothetical protein
MPQTTGKSRGGAWKSPRGEKWGDNVDLGGIEVDARVPGAGRALLYDLCMSRAT